MLSIHQAQVIHLDQIADAKFARSVRSTLVDEYPGFLPRFPPEIQVAIVDILIKRARAHGLTWESSIYCYCALSEAIAPNFFLDPVVQKYVEAAGPLIDERVLKLSDKLGEADWERMSAARSELPLYCPPHLDDAPLAERIAAALPLILFDEIAAADAARLAGQALTDAAALGLEAIEDAALVTATLRALYRGGLLDGSEPWHRDVLAGAITPAVRLEMLRFRTMLDHGRRV